MRRMFMMLPVIICLSIAVNTVTFAQVGVWVEKKDMPTARYAMDAAVLDGNIYVIGGWDQEFLRTVEMYDPKRDRWESKADLSQGNLGVAAATVNGKIYAIGGWGGGAFFSTVEEYDPVADTWTRKANMPTARQWVSAAVVDGIIYAIGDVNSSTVEAYDPLADKWSRKANLPLPEHGRCRTAVVKGKIYAMGWGVFGGPAGVQPRSDVYEYDPVLDTWEKKADMPTTRMVISADAVAGKIYAVGGTLGVDPFQHITKVEIYDPNQDMWMVGTDFPDASSYHASAVIDGRIYTIGGVDEWPDFENPNGWPSVHSRIHVFDTGLSVSLPGKLPTVWGSVKRGR